MGIKFNTQQGSTISKKEKKPSFWEKDIAFLGSSFSDKKKEEFYAELAILLRSGFNLKKALELLSETQKKESHRILLEDMTSKIVAGDSFFEVLQHNKNFSTYECQAIRIGETTGKLYEVTNDLHLFYKERNEQKRQVYSALSYPLIILITAVIVVAFMLVFVVPMFEQIFKQNNVELPFITRLVMDSSSFIARQGWIFLVFFIALPFLISYLKKQAWYKRPLDTIKLKIPLLGPYIKKVHITQFVQAMALLTNAKVPIVTGLSMVKDMVPFYPLKDSLEIIEKDIIKGEKMSDSFAQFSLYEKKITALLKVAEETNQTEFIFQKLFEQYSSELKYRSQIFTSLLNPIFIFVIAVLVTFILVAMYLPMFKLGSVIG